MRDASREAISFVSDRDFDSFKNDRRLILAIVKEIEIIGEAAGKVSLDCQKANLEIPWQDIIGMRHRLVHAYFDVDVSLVWKTVKYELPPLFDQLERIIGTPL